MTPPSKDWEAQLPEKFIEIKERLLRGYYSKGRVSDIRYLVAMAHEYRAALALTASEARENILNAVIEHMESKGFTTGQIGALIWIC